MRDNRYVREDGLNMVDATISTNDFVREHPGLDDIIGRVMNKGLEEDLTIEMFEKIEDPYIKEAWEKARYVAENVACLWAAEHLVGWGFGYRSDDGYDYLTAALDNARFLTDIDLDEKTFLTWWNAPSWDPNYEIETPDYPR